jgi:hypothetical protein
VNSNKISSGFIVVAIDQRNNGSNYHRFWQVIRATTNTCDLRELKYKVIKHTGIMLEVVPWLDNYIDDNSLRCKVSDNVVRIKNDCYASIWDGQSRFQTTMIINN